MTSDTSNTSHDMNGILIQKGDLVRAPFIESEIESERVYMIIEINDHHVLPSVKLQIVKLLANDGTFVEIFADCLESIVNMNVPKSCWVSE